MKITLTGKNSYLSNNFYKYLTSLKEDISCNIVTLRNDEWRKSLNTDIIINFAGLVHVNEKKYTEDDFMHINCQLPFEMAALAKKNGVKHFIFISTIAVYDLIGNLKGPETITSTTPLAPKTLYAKSKLAGENKVLALADKDFSVTVLRLPMVYGDNAPGNYKTLETMVNTFFIFPYIENQKSLLEINSFCEKLYNIILKKDSGIICLYDKSISTMELIKKIAHKKSKKIYFSKLLGTMVIHLNFVNLRKAFGNLTIDL